VTFLLKDGGAASNEIPGWPLPPRRPFAASGAYARLSRALENYVDQNIPGRSFLIAGHRGTGKTALVTRAIEDLRATRLRESVKESSIFIGGTRASMQRPLFVKLHGPSLIDSIAPKSQPKPADERPPDRDPPQEGERQPADEAQPERSAAEDSKGDRRSTHTALVQITLALYRALAEEISTGFAAHAQFLASRSRQANDYLEIAAQLTLELDSAPLPAVLRRYWSMLGRLSGQRKDSGFGVLWPRTADPTLRQLARNDQGFREIIAVATAAQAFRVTAGEITDKLDRSEEDRHEATLTAKAANLNSLIDRAGALLAGTLAGGAALAKTSPSGAVGLGLVTALLTGLVLGWTSTRTRKREQILKYTFIWRHDEATLERDLPTVIRRVRDAGLAPVFVFDELDKLDDPGGTIRDIIKRLKHLITDHGFFCFLTDRNYFDETEREIEKTAYPIEHTFFSERLLILYSSSEFLPFLQETIGIEPQTPENGFARLLLSLSLVHEAKLNFADLTRAVARLVGENGSLRVSSEEVRRQPHYQLSAVMQLAVDAILRGPAVVARLEVDPGFAQLAVDALYMVSRRWEQDEEGIDLTAPEPGSKDPDQVRDYLDKRLLGCTRMEAEKLKKKGSGVADSDLKLLRGEIGKLCELLNDLKLLRKNVAARSDLTVLNPQDVIPESLERLIERGPGQTWRFLFESTGLLKDLGAGELAAQTERLAAFVRAVERLMKASGIEVPNLVAAGVLPPSVTWAHVLEAAQVEPPPGGAPDPQRLLVLQEFDSVFSHRVAAIRKTILFVDLMRRSVELPLTDAPVVLTRLSGYIDFAAAGPSEASPGQFAIPAIDSRAPNLEADADWVDGLAHWLKGPEAASAAINRSVDDDRLGWDAWRGRLRDYFATSGEPVRAPDPPQMAELLLAAAGRPAGTWLHLPLNRMTVGEWSLLAVRAMESIDIPMWVAPAALRALGFGQPMLANLGIRLRSRITPSSWIPEDSAALDSILGGAPERPPGLLHIAARPGAVLDGTPGRHPVLGLLVKDYMHFQQQIYELYVMEAFKVKTDEPF
jgi:hypothetical protein